jgi:hypothetical protein
MLKNPCHLYRRDGKFYYLSLFRAKYLPRNGDAIRDINYCVAKRHYFMNNFEEKTYDNRLDFMYKSFYHPVALDFRPEHPIIDGFRINVSLEKKPSPVISTTVKKIVLKAAKKVFEEHAQDVDFLFYPEMAVYYVETDYLELEILNLLTKSRQIKKNLKINTNITGNFITPEARHLYLIKKTYENQQETLFTYVDKLNAALDDNNSLLSVNYKQIICKKNPKVRILLRKKTTVALRKWCVENKILKNFYKFLSTL